MAAISFTVTRTGDLTKDGSVVWTRSGTLLAADLVSGQASTGTLTWAANDATSRSIVVNTVGNTTDNPDRTCVITLSSPSNATLGVASATTNVIDDDAGTSTRCTNPRIGPARRVLESGKRLLFIHANISGPISTLSPVANKTTRVSYLTNSAFQAIKDSSGQYYFDLSDAGAKAQAQKIWNFHLARKGSNAQNNIAWWDWEERDTTGPYCINARPAANYNRNNDSWMAAQYDLLAAGNRHELRLEAARWNAEVCKQIYILADNAGHNNFEMYQYNLPDASTYGNRSNQTMFNGQAADIDRSLLCPYFLGGGSNAYYQAFSGNGPGDPTSLWTEWRVAESKSLRAAHGPNFMIIHTLWPLWASVSGFPVVAAGHTRAMMQALIDAGANGFTLFSSSDMNALTGQELTNCQARVKEIADIVANPANNFADGIRY